MMLVLLCQRRGQPDGEMWFTPDAASERFKAGTIDKPTIGDADVLTRVHIATPADSTVTE